MSDAILNIGGDTRQLERDIQRALSQNFQLKGFDSRTFTQPLGRITGQLGEFDKSLEASNARVVAFGASAGAIYLLGDAFKSVIKSTIEVEKSLTEINNVLGESDKNIKRFGDDLFEAANKTSSAFDTAAESALEFSRQGLGLEETIKRTTDALTLARLSGLSAADSVEALTAAVNTFSESGLTTAQIVNKLAAVDAKYAVSSADLAEAIKRVGSSAVDAGLNLDQLAALVTTAQERTARGGAVIGNSFKTIFTRLQRPQVIEDLQELGIQTTNAFGETLPLIQVLQNLAKTFDTLSYSQRASIAETVGGIYQINILKATLSDLSNEYGTYAGALQVSASATNEAEARIAALGETLDSQITRTVNNIKKAGSVIGELTLAPAIEKVLGLVNSVLEDFSLSKEPETLGEKAAQGFLKGLGSFISGPGLILAATAAFNIFSRLAKFIGDAGRNILGLNQAAQQQAQIQAQILQFLQKNPQLQQQILSGSVSIQQANQGILNIIQAQNAALAQQTALARTLTGTLMTSGVSVGMGGTLQAPVPRRRGRAEGYIPMYASGSERRMEELEARSLGATANVRAHMGKGTIGGQRFLMNNQEIEIPNFGANGDSAVIPMYASGYIGGKFYANDAAIGANIRVGNITLEQAAKIGYTPNRRAIERNLRASQRETSTTKIAGSPFKTATIPWNTEIQDLFSKRDYAAWNNRRSTTITKNKISGKYGNRYGEMYEQIVLARLQGQYGKNRVFRANDLGLKGASSRGSMFGQTAVDFIIANAIDKQGKPVWSAGGRLVEAKATKVDKGVRESVATKFSRAVSSNPQTLGRGAWKNLLIKRRAAGYIPRMAGGFSPNLYKSASNLTKGAGAKRFAEYLKLIELEKELKKATSPISKLKGLGKAGMIGSGLTILQTGTTYADLIGQDQYTGLEKLGIAGAPALGMALGAGLGSFLGPAGTMVGSTVGGMAGESFSNFLRERGGKAGPSQDQQLTSKLEAKLKTSRTREAEKNKPAINELNNALTNLADIMGPELTKNTAALQVLTEKLKEEKKVIQENFGGGAEAFRDPSKINEILNKMYQAQRTLADGRIGGIDRGRAAATLLETSGQLGINLPEYAKRGLSMQATAGLTAFQNQVMMGANMGPLAGRLGITAGIGRSYAASRDYLGQTGMSFAENQLSNTGLFGYRTGRESQVEMAGQGRTQNANIIVSKVYEDISKLTQMMGQGRFGGQRGEIQDKIKDVRMAALTIDPRNVESQIKAAEKMLEAISQLPQNVKDALASQPNKDNQTPVPVDVNVNVNYVGDSENFVNATASASGPPTQATSN